MMIFNVTPPRQAQTVFETIVAETPLAIHDVLPTIYVVSIVCDDDVVLGFESSLALFHAGSACKL